MIWIWLAAAILFGVVEGLTVGLVSIWFAIGAVAALIGAALGAVLWMQLLLFAVVSAAAVAMVRPLTRRFRAKSVPTNADRCVGRTARVTETIDNQLPAGAVYVDGKTWTARSADGTVIPEGSLVEVQRIEGVKLLVNMSEKKEEHPV